MTWVKIDDQFYDHPKAIKAGRDGRDLFIAGLCHCASMLTDGFIAGETLPLIAFKAGVNNGKKTAETLVSVGLWDTTDGGYLVHDYLDYNPSGARIKAERLAAKERMNRNRSEDVRPNNPRTNGEVRPMFGECSPYPVPVPVPDVPTEHTARPKPSPNPGSDGCLVEEKKRLLEQFPWWESALEEQTPAGVRSRIRYQAKIWRSWQENPENAPMPPKPPTDEQIRAQITQEVLRTHQRQEGEDYNAFMERMNPELSRLYRERTEQVRAMMTSRSHAPRRGMVA